MRDRVISTSKEYDELTLDDLGPRIRVDYVPGDGFTAGEGAPVDSGGDNGQEWLRGLLSDLVDDDLVEVEDSDGESVARIRW